MFFNLKDIPTLGNVLAGYSAMCLVVLGRTELAGLMVLVAVLFDLADGYIARTFFKPNKFGKELDNLADLVSYNMAPSVIAFSRLSSYSVEIAFIAGASILAAGTLRLARFNIHRIEVPGFFIGLPRPVSAVLIVSFLSSNIFTYFSGKYWFIILSMLFIVSISTLNITTAPYIGHHERKFDATDKILVFILMISVVLSYIQNIIWDMVFLLNFIYMLFPWLFMPKKVKDYVYSEMKSWNK